MQGCIPPSARVIPPVRLPAGYEPEHERNLNQGSVLSCVAVGGAVQQRTGGAEVFTLGGPLRGNAPDGTQPALGMPLG